MRGSSEPCLSSSLRRTESDSHYFLSFLTAICFLDLDLSHYSSSLVVIVSHRTFATVVIVSVVFFCIHFFTVFWGNTDGES